MRYNHLGSSDIQSNNHNENENQDTYINSYIDDVYAFICDIKY